MAEGNPCPMSVQFRFGINTLSAVGDWSDREHPNVLRLTIVRSRFDQAIISILLALPYAVQNLARSLVPGYFLPSRIVLKKMKPKWDDEFNNEAPMGELGTFGLMHGDPKLDNFLLVDGRIVILDLESVEEGEEEGDVEFVAAGNVEFARDRYKSYLKWRHMPQ